MIQLLSGSVGFVLPFLLLGVAMVIMYFFANFMEKHEVKDPDGCIGGCGSWLIFIAVFGIFALILNTKSCSCTNHSRRNDYDPDEEYWENTPRHTYLPNKILDIADIHEHEEFANKNG